MRFLGVGETCDLGALYLALQADGHEVRVAVSHPLAQTTLEGLVPKVADWRAELPWIRAAGDNGVILFESVSEGLGGLQDSLRADGFRVVGGSAYGDRLENDRAFGQQVLGELGFPEGHAWRFRDRAEAAAFIASHPARYVLKRSGAEHTAADTYIGRLDDGSDVSALLAAPGPGDDFLLMAFIEGVEMGVGAYFDGHKFLRPACLDWEHKHFFAGGMGELTGEMGTVATFTGTDAFFDLTLAQMESRLRAAGHVGYVNLNTIVNAQGVWPLEFTCRFGYPGYAVLSPLQLTPWADLLRAMAAGAGAPFRAAPGYSVGIVVSTPPFPYSREEVAAPVGLPILFGPGLDRRHVHVGEMGLNSAGQLATAGLYGWTMVVTGVAGSLAEAQRAAYANVAQVVVPNGRYRLDIGDALLGGAHEKLASWTDVPALSL